MGIQPVHETQFVLSVAERDSHRDAKRRRRQPRTLDIRRGALVDPMRIGGKKAPAEPRQRADVHAMTDAEWMAIRRRKQAVALRLEGHERLRRTRDTTYVASLATAANRHVSSTHRAYTA